MRLATWNCRVGGFRKKARLIAPFRPDVLAVQECEPLDDELFLDGECQPGFRDRPSREEVPRRGIAMLSYSDVAMSRLTGESEIAGFQRYEAARGALQFNVVAVWTSAAKPASAAYRQLHAGLTRHAEWLRTRPTVVLGDFNANASFRSRTWPDLMTLTDDLGLVSAYHHHFAEPFGEETRPTHFFLGKESAPFHLDYCFVPGEWASRITEVQVGAYGEWRPWSDHAPVIVDVDV